MIETCFKTGMGIRRIYHIQQPLKYTIKIMNVLVLIRMNSQYPGYTWWHLVDSDLSCHMVLGSTCRFLQRTVKRFHSSFHTNHIAGNHSCQRVTNSLMIHRRTPCLNLFKISRKTSPFLCSLSVLCIGNTNMFGYVDHIPRMHCLGDYCTIWCYTNRLSRVQRIEAQWYLIDMCVFAGAGVAWSGPKLYSNEYGILLQYSALYHHNLPTLDMLPLFTPLRSQPGLSL